MATILLIDDDPAICETLTVLLQGAGYQVLTAAHGDAALVQRQHPVDLILSDDQLPGLDGIAFVLHLRADRADHALPFILMRTSPRRPITDPHITYLAKPLDPTTLLTTIGRMITIGS